MFLFSINEEGLFVSEPNLADNGKELIFKGIYVNHFKKVESFAYKYLQDGEKAREVAQDVFVSVWENMEKLWEGKDVVVDIWKWNAASIPPSKKEGSNLAVSHFCSYDLNKKQLTLLSGDDMPYLQFPDGDCEDITIGFNNEKYEKYEGIEPSVPFDSYLVNMKTGERRLVLERQYYTPSISYDKQYIAWFECADSSWYSMNTKTLDKRNMTAQINDIFYNDELDIPMHSTHLGFVGWTDSGHSILVNSKYDFWKIDAAGVETK